MSGEVRPHSVGTGVAARSKRGPELGRGLLTPRWMMLWIVLAFFVALEIITRLGLVPATVLIPPSEMISGIWIIFKSGTLGVDFARTMIELISSAVIAIVLGIPIGMLFWRLPLLGKMFEPYIIGLYAVPLVIFYPFALVILGLGSGPIIAIASTMGLVPIVLNSWIAFSEIPEIYFKVSQSFGCRGWERFRKVTIPAAAPLIFAGLKLGVVYSFIGVIAMEFITAAVGLGFRVSYDYDSFKTQQMYAYILVILVLSIIMTSLLMRGERGVRGGAE